MKAKKFHRVLAVDPFAQGIGFAVLEGPHELIDWGLKTTRQADNKKVARTIEALIDRYRPDILALEDWNAEDSRRCDRVQTLLDRIAAVDPKRVRVCLVSLRRLRTIGPLRQTSTKYGRARFLADRFPELDPFLPPIRRIWMTEDCRMAIFDAVGFALACYPAGAVAQNPPSLPDPTGSDP